MPLTKMFCHLQGLSTITSSCWQCNLILMLPMLCLECPAMYNVHCTTAWLLYVRLMENGLVSSSASLTISQIFYIQLILHMKTTLRLSVFYWRHTNGWSFLTMISREQQQRNCGRRLQSSWHLRHWIYQTSMSLQVLKALSIQRSTWIY